MRVMAKELPRLLGSTDISQGMLWSDITLWQGLYCSLMLLRKVSHQGVFLCRVDGEGFFHLWRVSAADWVASAWPPLVDTSGFQCNRLLPHGHDSFAVYEHFSPSCKCNLK